MPWPLPGSTSSCTSHPAARRAATVLQPGTQDEHAVQGSSCSLVLPSMRLTQGVHLLRTALAVSPASAVLHSDGQSARCAVACHVLMGSALITLQGHSATPSDDCCYHASSLSLYQRMVYILLLDTHNHD